MPTTQDVVIGLAWMVGFFAFLPVMLFLFGKTSLRTLTISPEGITTQIGSLKGEVPWKKVRVVTSTSEHVLVVGTTGNAFFIPVRAFKGAEDLDRFLAQIAEWCNAVLEERDSGRRLE